MTSVTVFITQINHHPSSGYFHKIGRATELFRSPELPILNKFSWLVGIVYSFGMSLHNSKKRPAPSQGGPATKKANIQRLDKLEERKNRSKGRSAPGKDVKTPVKRKHEALKTSTELEEVKRKKRAVPVTETLDKEDSNSEEDGASELDEDKGDIGNVDEMEVDEKDDAAPIKDPNGAFTQTPVQLHCMIAWDSQSRISCRPAHSSSIASRSQTARSPSH